MWAGHAVDGPDDVQDHGLEQRHVCLCDFEPNLTNTVVFQLMAAMHASSFLANYEGHPFMQNMFSNKPLFYSLCVFVGTIFATGGELLTELNEALSLVPYPNADFRNQILTLLALDIGLSVGLS